MKKKQVSIVIAAAAVCATATVPVAASADARATCSSGYVCIYSGTSTSGSIIRSYYNYGTYPISITGSHAMYNHQTGGAKAYHCTTSTGGGTCTNVTAGTSKTVNFGTVRSILLES